MDLLEFLQREENPELDSIIEANKDHLMNAEDLIAYDPVMCQIVRYIGSHGGSMNKMATGCGVPLEILEAWSKEIPELARALQVAEQLAIVYHEEIGDAAAAGLIPKHAASTYKFRAQNQFPKTFSEGSVSVAFEVDPVKAAEAYRKLLRDISEPT